MKPIWTETATRGWNRVANYILREFGQRGFDQFLRDVKKCEQTIEKFPNSGSIEWIDERGTVYRYFVVHRRSKMLYFELNGTIYIANFWDIRALCP